MSGSNLAILREFSNVEMGVTKKKMSLTGQISHMHIYFVNAVIWYSHTPVCRSQESMAK